MSAEESKLYWLKREIKAWIAEGIIDETQADAILSRYGTEEILEAQERSSRLITILSILGSVLLGIGVILFFASNWQAIPRPVKLLLIFAAIAGANHIGYSFRFEKKNYPRVGGALLLLGAILFGAGIWLVAQIFNIKAYYPNGVLAWAAGVLPMGYVLGLNSILGLGLLISTLWIGMEAFFRLSLEPSGFLIGVIFGYGLLLYSLGLVHSQVRRLETHRLPYKAVGGLVLLLLTFVLTFSFSQEANQRIQEQLAFTLDFYLGYFLLPVVALAFSTGALYLGHIESKTLRYEVVGLIPIIAMFALFVFYPIRGMLYPYVFNLLLLYVIVGLLYVGYYNREGILINLAMVFFVVEVFTRYFDFFWRLLPRSIFFIVGGLVLLLGGLQLEKKRREIMKQLEREVR